MDSITGSFQELADFREKNFERIPLSGCSRSFQYAILVQDSW